MVMNTVKLYRILAFSGALPFIASALALYMGLNNVPLLGAVNHVVATYALVIVVFMAGTHWGGYLNGQHNAPINLLLFSNVVTVFAWLVFLSASVMVALLVYTVVFIVLLWIDYKLYQADLISPDYWLTRRNVTVIVIVCLLAHLPVV